MSNHPSEVVSPGQETGKRAGASSEKLFHEVSEPDPAVENRSVNTGGLNRFATVTHARSGR
jgi:hypothetical protein